MSKQTNPAKLGIFVLVAIALALATLVVVSSGTMFKKTQSFVMYFKADVTGLSTGAPVLYRGVTIGQVTKIQLIYNTESQSALVPVYIEIDPTRFVLKGELGNAPIMEDLIKKGLRAQLQTQSFITGMLQISLVQLPNTPISMVKSDPNTQEIPTAPALIQVLSSDLKEMNFKEIITDFQDTLKGFKEITQEIQEQKILKSTSVTLTNLEGLSQTLSKDLPEVTEEMIKTSTSVQDIVAKGSTVLSHAEVFMKTVNTKAPEILQGAQENNNKLLELQTALTNFIEQAEGMFAADSPLSFEIASFLERYMIVGAKLEDLIETLERNPESIIKGKPKQP